MVLAIAEERGDDLRRDDDGPARATLASLHARARLVEVDIRVEQPGQLAGADPGCEEHEADGQIARVDGATRLKPATNWPISASVSGSS